MLFLGLVKRAPGLHQLGCAPAIHHQMVELDAQPVQFIVGSQQQNSPRRPAIAQIEGLRHALIPAARHGRFGLAV